MRLSEIVNPNMIWTSLESKNKDQVIMELASKISAGVASIGADDIAAALRSRENLGSTAIQDSVAIPHAKITGIDKAMVAFGRSLKGIDFEAPDQKSTRLFFVLLAPQESSAMHLKILARLSRLLKESSFRKKLMEAEKVEDIHRIIIEEDGKI